MNFETALKNLPDLSPNQVRLLGQELHIYTIGDLIEHYPIRYENYTHLYTIKQIASTMDYITIQGTLHNLKLITGKKKRLIGTIIDSTGSLQLVWFKRIAWFQHNLKIGSKYSISGKPQSFHEKINIVHPEIEIFTKKKRKNVLKAIYPTTEKLKKYWITNKWKTQIIRQLLFKVPIIERLPFSILHHHKLILRKEALWVIHFPTSHDLLEKAQRYLKFEELFFLHLRLIKWQKRNPDKLPGQIFKKTTLFREFYIHHLAFQLTNAQQRILKEIYKDFCSGKQMNRLLQGDVGSGKTIIAFLSMLIIIDSGAQAALMVPTAVLAEQHFQYFKQLAEPLGLSIELLVGSTTQKERKSIYKKLSDGSIQIIIGTHTLIQEKVQYKNIGLAVIDEQHRFGVMQRSIIWHKNQINKPPHILVMTATPIPRTLAMTLYGDLTVSVIDEMPIGRVPIQTKHCYDIHRLNVFRFLHKQIALGHQAYIVYPLIEESDNVSYKYLIDGYESICRAFPKIQVSIVHGKMTPQNKAYEMQRFLQNHTAIMVATTVIEVGIHVPNATVMVIENAERFGLAQLHQLRGRVGRDTHQSYCILMTSHALTKEGKVRMKTMVETNDGFVIANTDLKLRGPGNLMGVQQSGLLNFKIANLSTDEELVYLTKKSVQAIIKQDLLLENSHYILIKKHMDFIDRTQGNWEKIS